ncbi:MAG: tetratricopeptide repeat protein, partial [Hydrococcus sp. RM1_1_31]|nr:tetratricopeptide repeat protein [Hydrococcus sp. RM1_1_31]
NYNQALELKPDFTEAYINRGNAYLNLKDYQLVDPPITNQNY